MNNCQLRLRRIGLEPPEMARPIEWIENWQIIIIRSKLLHSPLKARMLRTSNSRLYLKVETGNDLEAGDPALSPGVYFRIARGARLNGFESLAVKPGLHDISTVIRICRSKLLKGQDASLWATRRKVLEEISRSYKWLDTGIYEIRNKESLEPQNVQTSFVFRIRRPDFASGTITDAEQQKLKRHLNNWTRRAQRTEPLEKEGLIKAINQLYSSFQLKPPRIVIVPSPLVLAIAGSIATALCYACKNRQAKNDPARNAFAAVITGEVYDATVATDFHAIENSIDSATLRLFEKLIQDAADEGGGRLFRADAGAVIDNALSDASSMDPGIISRDQPWALKRSIASNIYHATRGASGTGAGTGTDIQALLSSWFGQNGDLNTLPERLLQAISAGRNYVRDLMQSCLQDCGRMLGIGNRQRYDELLTTALKEVLGLDLAARENNAAWQNVASRCAGILLHEEFCMVSEYPEVLNIDEQGRPHCEDGPSYVWRDGWTLYHWHGTRVNKQIIEQMETLSVEDIKNEANLEVRRLMLERYGTKRFLIDSGAAEFQRDDCGVLYRQEVHPQLEALVMVKVVNSTAEPDGTFKDYFLRVPPYISSAKEAVAWTFGVQSEEYYPLVQT